MNGQAMQKTLPATSNPKHQQAAPVNPGKHARQVHGCDRRPEESHRRRRKAASKRSGSCKQSRACRQREKAADRRNPQEIEGCRFDRGRA